MLLPVSVSDPLRINATGQDSSQSPSRPQSPTHLDSDNNNNNLFVSPADILFHPRSLSISPFGEKIIKNDNANIEKDVIDWDHQQDHEDYHPFEDPGSGQTTAVPTRHPSPARHHDEIFIQNLPPLVRTRRRGRSGTARKGLHLWPLIINRNPHRSPSNARKSWITFGPKNQDLKTVGVDVCLRWVTDEPKPRELPLPPTPPPTPVEEENQVQLDNIHSNNCIVESSQEKLLKIVQDAIRHVEGTLESLNVDQNILYLHTQHYLSVADADVNGEMFLLEGKMADLEECVERIKVLRDDILYVHRWHLNSPTSEDGGEDGEELEVGTFAFTERDVLRRLRACFEPSTWWKEYDLGSEKQQAEFAQDEEESSEDDEYYHGLESDDDEESTSED